MRTFVVVALALAASACVREEKLVDRFVEKYCEARWACGCDSPGLTQVHCESMLIMAGDEAQAAAQDAGLEYDRECAKAWLDAIDDSCGLPSEASYFGRECGDPCSPYHGGKRKGEPCERFGPWSDCARELHCGNLDRCEDLCDGQHEGDHCPHDVSGTCGPALTCDDGTCTPKPALGEPCVGPCATGTTCDVEQGVCVEAAGFGEPCGISGDCGRSLWCNDGVCDVTDAKVCFLETPWG